MLQVTEVGGCSYRVPPEDYTLQAWLACLCCFWPIGLMAVLRAYEVPRLHILLSPAFLIKKGFKKKKINDFFHKKTKTKTFTYVTGN